MDLIVQEEPQLDLKYKLTEGLRTLPRVALGTALAYFLDVASCAVNIEQYLPADGLNVPFHIAAGAGLYGGWTDKLNRGIATLLVLGGSMIPEIMLAANGDMEMAGQMAGAKVVGYGVGYLTGALFSGNWGWEND